MCRSILLTLLLLGTFGATAYAQTPVDTTFNQGIELEYDFGYSASATTLLALSDESYLAGYVGSGCFSQYIYGTVAKVENLPGGLAVSSDYASHLDTNFKVGWYSDHQCQDTSSVLFLGYERSIDSGGGSQIYVERRLLSNSGVLDSTFGTGGIVKLFFPLDYLVSDALRVLPDGRFVVSAEIGDSLYSVYDCLLVRFLPDGKLDSSFATNGVGRYRLDSNATYLSVADLQIQDDGKYLLAVNIGDGTKTEATMARIHPDGTLDSSFGSGGVVRFSHEMAGGNTWVESVVSMPDGSSLVALNFSDSTANGYRMKLRIVKLTPQGGIDSTFATDGWFVLTSNLGVRNSFVRRLKVREDGLIVAGGVIRMVVAGFDYPFILALNPDGSMHGSFNQTGLFCPEVFSEGITDFVFQDEKLTYLATSRPYGEFQGWIGRLILGPRLVGTPEEVENDFSMFPNPTSHQVTLKSSLRVPVSIYSLDGRLLIDSPAAFNHTLDLSGLAKGVYMVRAGNAVKRLVKE